MMNQVPTQHDMILEFMRLNEWITPMDAIDEIGCTKLSTRIGELVLMGYEIERQTVRKKNRWGKPIHYTRYRLVA